MKEKFKTFLYSLNKPGAGALWIILWIPLSMFFPRHADFPIPRWAAPVASPIFLMKGPWPSNLNEWWGAFALLHGAAIFFWVGLFAMLFLFPLRKKTRGL